MGGWVGRGCLCTIVSDSHPQADELKVSAVAAPMLYGATDVDIAGANLEGAMEVALATAAMVKSDS